MVRKLFLILLILSPLKATSEGRWATGDFEPYTGTSLQGGGFIVELVALTAKKASLPHQMLFLPWARGFIGVQKNQFEGTFPYAYSKERDNTFLYTAPIIQTEGALFTHKDDIDDYDLDETKLNGKTACVPRYYSPGEELMTLANRGVIRIERAPNDLACLEMIALKRLDFFAMDRLIGNTLISQHPRLSETLTVQRTISRKIEYHFIISKNHETAHEFIARFNEALKKVYRSKEWEDIQKRHQIKTQLVPSEYNQDMLVPRIIFK